MPNPPSAGWAFLDSTAPSSITLPLKIFLMLPQLIFRVYLIEKKTISLAQSKDLYYLCTAF